MVSEATNLTRLKLLREIIRHYYEGKGYHLSSFEHPFFPLVGYNKHRIIFINVSESKKDTRELKRIVKSLPIFIDCVHVYISGGDRFTIIDMWNLDHSKEVRHVLLK